MRGLPRGRLGRVRSLGAAKASTGRAWKDLRQPMPAFNKAFREDVMSCLLSQALSEGLWSSDGVWVDLAKWPGCLGRGLSQGGRGFSEKFPS